MAGSHTDVRTDKPARTSAVEAEGFLDVKAILDTR
jgi:hypothetical protein